MLITELSLRCIPGGLGGERANQELGRGAQRGLGRGCRCGLEQHGKGGGHWVVSGDHTGPAGRSRTQVASTSERRVMGVQLPFIGAIVKWGDSQYCNIFTNVKIICVLFLSNLISFCKILSGIYK